ncbi:MAG: FAD-binding protein, partial [Gammaproteobacteria bacterium]|nr:FAD-binding protein [Gammaproteobacteria bacterium]
MITDILIIGSGAAGLTAAIELADFANITLLSKGDANEGSTLYAQGGIAAVTSEEDSIESHVADTLNAGAGLCHREVVEYTVSRSASAMRQLILSGVPFCNQKDKLDEYGMPSLHLTREGGHSHRRVLHATDATGRAVETTLLEQAQHHPAITIKPHHMVVDLILSGERGTEERRVAGAYILDTIESKVVACSARFVILATGGASKVYLYTSNPDISTGDGIAMAWRAGCRVANMEFIQFHPTCLYHPEAKSFLISEAIRGEGGILVRRDGSRFMDEHHPKGELAPRDIVAR